MEITLRGRVFWLFFGMPGRSADGWCDDPKNPEFILISDEMTEREELRTLIHEMMHGCFWDVAEKYINDFSTACANCLITAGVYKGKPGRRPSPKLRILLHDAMRAFLWMYDDDSVDSGSRDIAAVLTKLGWRKDG